MSGKVLGTLDLSWVLKDNVVSSREKAVSRHLSSGWETISTDLEARSYLWSKMRVERVRPNYILFTQVPDQDTAVLGFEWRTEWGPKNRHRTSVPRVGLALLLRAALCPPGILHLQGAVPVIFSPSWKLLTYTGIQEVCLLISRKANAHGRISRSRPQVRSVERNQWLDFLWVCYDMALKTEIWRGLPEASASMAPVWCEGLLWPRQLMLGSFGAAFRWQHGSYWQLVAICFPQTSWKITKF